MIRYSLRILMVAMAVLLPPIALRAAEPASAPGGQAETTAAVPNTPDPAADAGYDPIREFAARVGAWGVTSAGSPTKVGEYQSLQSSPFWNVDGISSDGYRTADFTASGTDNESTDGVLRFYGGPGLSVNAEYLRYPHELDAKTYSGFVAIPQGVNGGAGNTNHAKDNYYTYDNLNTGQDYAIRVQEFKANFKGYLTDNVKWRVNVFGLNKEGERQANAMTHCFDASNSPYTSAVSGTTVHYTTGTNTQDTRQCHALSQAQHIDWRTTEVTPGLEINLGGIQVEYSHLFRRFEQNDQEVFNVYRYSANQNTSGSLGFPNYSIGGTVFSMAGYNIVPDTTTQIDRIKIHGEIADNTDAYAFGYLGYNEDDLRLNYRHFGGADVRITNKSIDGVAITGYGKVYSENTETPTTALNVLYPTAAQKQFYQEAPTSPSDPTPFFVGTPINRDTDSVGLDTRWKPFFDEIGTRRAGLAFIAGYDYSQIRRTYAFDTLTSTGTDFYQPDTNKNTFTFGIEEKWSRRLTSYIRYRYIGTEYPLFGISPEATGPTGPGTATSPNDSLNTLLPRIENRLEVTNVWSPTDYFMINATFYVEDAVNHGPWANFASTSYPFMINAMLRPTDVWTLTAGYADFANWINQDVTLTAAATGSAPTNPTAPWRYMTQANVFNVGTAYAVTTKVTLTGEAEYVRGVDAVTSVGQVAVATPTTPAVSFQNPPSPYLPLGQYSLVSVNTYRIGAGVDYLLRPRCTMYFRYNFFDYGDEATGLTSGRTHMFLAGATARF